MLNLKLDLQNMIIDDVHVCDFCNAAYVSSGIYFTVLKEVKKNTDGNDSSEIYKFIATTQIQNLFFDEMPREYMQTLRVTREQIAEASAGLLNIKEVVINNLITGFRLNEKTICNNHSFNNKSTVDYIRKIYGSGNPKLIEEFETGLAPYVDSFLKVYSNIRKKSAQLDRSKTIKLIRFIYTSTESDKILKLSPFDLKLSYAIKTDPVNHLLIA